MKRACKVFITASSVNGPNRWIKSSISIEASSVTTGSAAPEFFLRISWGNKNNFCKKFHENFVYNTIDYIIAIFEVILHFRVWILIRQWKRNRNISSCHNMITLVWPNKLRDVVARLLTIQIGRRSFQIQICYVVAVVVVQKVAVGGIVRIGHLE